MLLVCTGIEWPLLKAKENLCSCRGEIASKISFGRPLFSCVQVLRKGISSPSLSPSYRCPTFSFPCRISQANSLMAIRPNPAGQERPVLLQNQTCRERWCVGAGCCRADVGGSLQRELGALVGTCVLAVALKKVSS